MRLEPATGVMLGIPSWNLGLNHTEVPISGRMIGLLIQINIVAARLHDIGRSGKWPFLYLPFIGLLTALAMCDMADGQQDNQ
ncbi:DUF805 domain-containing protein [Deinococcus sp. KSM4-11]|uniref:DUF805 domain-containing protein n=1 Tax=Deinococcus sp. KSM4-11 TaxID=2568654 RepID=UPI0010A31055|nr:DUF805 domain-containing protein [Deinococcus sp. KSM4-11]THF85100.1 DUF805 domain-containing protein [Deinococcus sp. KSM4-11]